jgi:hypothetical protein
VKNDPLGLTEDQRIQSDMAEFVNTMPERWARNREIVEALPPGTIVRIVGQPDRTREHLLELMP